MQISILGPGAMGCLFGACLARSHHDVVMVDHRTDRAELIASRGILVTGMSGDFTAKVEATTDAAKTSDADVIMICVKSYDTATAITRLPRELSSNSAVLTLQNGLGNVELIAERFGADRAYAGTTALGATLLAPGHVRHSGAGVTVVGRFESAPDENVARIVTALNDAGLEARTTTDVNVTLWNKVVVNAAINPLTALTGVRNGQLIDLPEARALLALVVRECEMVARSGDAAGDALTRVEEVCERTALNVSSMLQDIIRAKRTEIRSINAAVADEAERQGIVAPVNLVLTELVAVLEKRKPFWREDQKREYGLD